MIEKEKLDVRTITMGISLLVAAIPMVKDAEKIYDKITRKAENLVRLGRY